MSKCATIGCESAATERITYSYRNDGMPGPDTDDVCGECADGYQNRVSLTDFRREPIAAKAEAAPLTGHAAFFWEHAGWSYPAGATETEQQQARAENARELAAAERARQSAGAWFRWEYDPDGATTAGDSKGPWYRADLCRYGPNGESAQLLASLGGIDSQPGTDYARVIEAQLALEARSELEPDREAV